MLRNCLKMAWKVLGRRKFFTFVSLFGIGFTMTALMIVVALADQQLAPTYPETALNRMLTLERMKMFGDRSNWHSGPGFKFIDRYGRGLPGVERMSVYTPATEAVSFREGRKLVFNLRYTDAEYWWTMQFMFLEGAPYTAENDRNADRVAVISDNTRLRLFGDVPAFGKSFELDGVEYRVIGVVRNVSWLRMSSAADMWMPLHNQTAAGFFDRLMGGCEAVYLLNSGTDKKEVQAAFRERLTRVEFDDPEQFHTMEGYPMTRLEILASMPLGLEAGETAPRRLILLAVLITLAFMALPAINLVNINLSRIYERSGEIGVRKAFGAASMHLVLQFVVENIFLCLIGGALGLVSAYMLLKLLAYFPGAPFMAFHLNWRVFLAALILAAIFGFLSGVWPAWKMSRQHPVSALRGGVS